MIDLFIIKLILSFLVGGIYIAAAIRISEKFGSKIGGIITGLPSTVLVSLIFIAWTQNPQAAVSAIPIIPAAISACILFLVAFIYFYKYGKLIAFLGALSTWTIISLPLVLVKLDNLLASIVIAIILFALGINYLNKLPNRKIENLKSNKYEFLIRAIISGLIISLAVYLAKVGGPLWGGLFTSFPAAFLTSVYLLEKKHGIKFTSSVIKSMPYGSIGIIGFVTAFYYLTPAYGIIIGIIISYLISLLIAVIIYKVFLNNNFGKI